MRPRILEKAVFWTFTALVLFIIYLPLYWIVTTSIKTPIEAFQIPPVLIFKPTFDNYIATLFPQAQISMVGAHALSLNYFSNSIVMAGASTLLAATIAMPAAYGFSRCKFRGRRDLQFWILSTVMAPPIAVIVPYYVMWKYLGLLNTYPSLIIMYVILNLPLAIWLLKSFFDDVPREIEEASLIDGCSEFNQFFRITLPIIYAGLVVTGFFCFLISWNELLFALILTGSQTATAPIGLYGFLSLQGVMWGQLCTSSVLYMIPPLVFIIIFRKRLTRVISLGVVKG